MEQKVVHMSRNKALMASALIEDLTWLVDQHGDLPVLVGAGRTLTTPDRPKAVSAVKEERVKTTFVCHRPLPNDINTIPVIHIC